MQDGRRTTSQKPAGVPEIGASVQGQLKCVFENSLPTLQRTPLHYNGHRDMIRWIANCLVYY